MFSQVVNLALAGEIKDAHYTLDERCTVRDDMWVSCETLKCAEQGREVIHLEHTSVVRHWVLEGVLEE